jgi:hypothetical protein
MAVVLAKPPDLWSLVLDSIEIDPEDLLAAIEAEAVRPGPDFRTRVLLRDSFLALRNRWGEDQLRARLSADAAAIVTRFLNEALGEKGFSSLEKRLMEQRIPAAMGSATAATEPENRGEISQSASP